MHRDTISPAETDAGGLSARVRPEDRALRALAFSAIGEDRGGARCANPHAPRQSAPQPRGAVSLWQFFKLFWVIVRFEGAREARHALRTSGGNVAQLASSLRPCPPLFGRACS